MAGSGRTSTAERPGPAGRRFLTLPEVAEVLSVSVAQVYALVRNGDLPAIKIGGRGQWRVEASVLEEFIARMYEDTRAFVDAHPLSQQLGREDEVPPELR